MRSLEESNKKSVIEKHGYSDVQAYDMCIYTYEHLHSCSHKIKGEQKWLRLIQSGSMSAHITENIRHLRFKEYFMYMALSTYF